MGWLARTANESVHPAGTARLTRRIAGLRADVSFAGVDGVVVVLSYLAAIVIRFADPDVGMTDMWWAGLWTYLPVIVMVHLSANALLGAYGHVWEYASVEEAMRLVVAVVSSACVLLVGLVIVQGLGSSSMRLIPVTVVFIGAGIALGGMGAVRFRSRLFSFRRGRDRAGRTALVIGTGQAAADLARRGKDDETPTFVLGFVGENTDERRLAGAEVLGRIDDLPELVARHRPDDVVIAGGIGPDKIRRVVDLCMDVDVGLRTIPDTNSHRGGLSDVRELELSDLLARPTVTTDLTSVAQSIAGRRVLVTGAGGSIGSEIVRQVAGFDPESVVALDHDESHLHEAGLEWGRLDHPPPIPLLADICDRRTLERAIVDQKPDVIFHAAAHKHVPILEQFPEEALKTNVFGTLHLLEVSESIGVERFVLISTDKAVEPSSVMGASKRVAELLVQTAAARSAANFSAVRFGNVLGSRGSVVPTFVRQIKAGGPVTVSDPSMLRFFMLISEAVELVLQASALSERGEIFVLDMGEPVCIGDLAHRMIRLAGLVPGRDIDVEIMGARPGEKVAEVLSSEPLLPSAHPQIRVARPGAPCPQVLDEAMRMLEELMLAGRQEYLRDVLMALAWRHWGDAETVDLREVVTHTLDTSA